MKVQCKGCRIEFTILNDKVPEGQTLKILCPKCKRPPKSVEKSPPTALTVTVRINPRPFSQNLVSTRPWIMLVK